MSRRLSVLAVLAAVCAAAIALPASGANFASRTTNPVSVATDAVSQLPAAVLRRVRIPTGCSSRTRPSASRARRVCAATGVDGTLRVALGGFKNTNTTSIPRVFSVQARGTLPAGVSSITVTATLLPDPGGKQPLTGYSFTNMLGLGSATTVTLGAGDKRWLNLSASMRGSAFPGNNVLYRPTVRITVRYTGYTGNFLSYDVPVTIWDGNGAGP